MFSNLGEAAQFDVPSLSHVNQILSEANGGCYILFRDFSRHYCRRFEEASVCRDIHLQWLLLRCLLLILFEDIFIFFAH